MEERRHNDKRLDEILSKVNEIHQRQQESVIPKVEKMDVALFERVSFHHAIIVLIPKIFCILSIFAGIIFSACKILKAFQ